MTKFSKTLLEYKSEIDKDLEIYSGELLKDVKKTYGANSEVVISAFTSILLRGGKRIRGTLTEVAYEWAGGKNKTVSSLAARATEIIQAYLLITDDIIDRSPSRRGGPSAHKLLADYHKKHGLKDDPEHFGTSMAYMAGAFAAHEAIRTLEELPLDTKTICQAVDIVNKNIQVTWQGQINDVFNEVTGNTSVKNASEVILWKTAHYSFISPLVLGVVLAGADKQLIKALESYGMHCGMAFQMMNDISDTFNGHNQSGKDPRDDIREGKMTLLIIHALNASNNVDKQFLSSCLGDAKLAQADFEKCKQIILSSKAKEDIEIIASSEIQEAIKYLEKLPAKYRTQQLEFLKELALDILKR